jgi:hypothetical protein
VAADGSASARAGSSAAAAAAPVGHVVVRPRSPAKSALQRAFPNTYFAPNARTQFTAPSLLRPPPPASSVLGSLNRPAPPAASFGPARPAPPRAAAAAAAAPRAYPQGGAAPALPARPPSAHARGSRPRPNHVHELE